MSLRLLSSLLIALKKNPEYIDFLKICFVHSKLVEKCFRMYDLKRCDLLNSRKLTQLRKYHSGSKNDNQI